MCSWSQIWRRVRKLQEVFDIVSLVSSLISVNHLVEEQCFLQTQPYVGNTQC